MVPRGRGATRERGPFVVEGTVGYFDISGFTRINERLAAMGREGAELVKTAINAVFAPLIEVVLGSGGDVLKFGGDALFVLFAGDGHEFRAAVAAAEMHRRIAAVGAVPTPLGPVRLKMSAALHRGSIDVVPVGDERRDVLVVGPAVTAVLELEADANSGTTRVSPAFAACLDRGWVSGPVLATHRIPAPDQVAAEFADTGETGASWVPPPLRRILGVSEVPGEHKQVAIAFVERRGTDASGGQAAARDEALVAATEAIERLSRTHGVMWLESDVGRDAVRWLLVGGAPDALEDAEERMLRTVRELLDEHPELNAGISAGHVFVGDIGHPSRRTYNVMGDSVNVAARLMARAEPGSALVERTVFDRLGAASRRWGHGPVTAFAAKGKRLPITAAALGELEEQTRAGAGVGPDELLGREADLERLRAAVSGVLGSGGLIDVVGEPGVGKSSLVAAAIGGSGAADRPEPITVHVTTADTGSPFAVVRRIVRALAGRTDGIGEYLRHLLDESAPHLRPMRSLLLTALGVADESPVGSVPDEVDPAFRLARTQDALVDLLVVGRSGPVQVVVEDVQWADEASLGVIRRFGAVPRAGWCFVTTRRPASESTGGVLVHVDPLDRAAARAVLLRAAGHRALSDATIERLLDAATGNPLFIGELAAALAAGVTEIPDRIERVIAARIDTLPAADRQLLRRIAVAGDRLDTEMVAEVLGIDIERVHRGAMALASFVEIDPNGRLVFRHHLLREVAAGGLPFRDRRAVHRSAARALAEDAAFDSDRAPVIARHFHAARDAVGTWTWAPHAAEFAASIGAVRDAAELHRLATEAGVLLGATVPRREIAIQHERMGDRAEIAGELELATLGFRAARRNHEHPLDRARVTRRQADVARRQARHTLALRLLTEAERLAAGESARSRLERARIGVARGNVLFHRGRLDASAVRTRRSIEGVSDRRLLAQAYLQLEVVASIQRRPDRAELERLALRHASACRDRLLLGKLALNLGVSAYNEGRWDDALASYASAHAEFSAAGDVVGAGLAMNNRAELLTDQGRLDEAEVLLVEAQRVTVAAGYTVGTLIALSGRSRVALRRGDLADAAARLAAAGSGFEAAGALEMMADTAVRHVELAVAAGEPDDALRLAAEAAERLRSLGDGVAILPLALERFRAAALVAGGRPDEGRRALAAVVTAADRDGAAYEAGVAATWLARLADPDAPPDSRLSRLGVVAVPSISGRVA